MITLQLLKYTILFSMFTAAIGSLSAFPPLINTFQLQNVSGGVASFHSANELNDCSTSSGIPCGKISTV